MDVISLQDVAREIRKAIAILRRFPAVKAKGFRQGGMLPEQEDRDFCENGLIPTPQEIDRMWEVCFTWLGWLDADNRRLVWARCSGKGWKQLAYKHHISRSTAIRRFNESCALIWGHLPKKQSGKEINKPPL